MQKLDFKSVARKFVLVILVLIFVPLLFRIRITIPLLSLMLAQIAILYLSVLLQFPRVPILEIIRRGTIYLFFVASSFAFLSLVPFSHRLIKFIYDSSGHWFGMVSVNLVAFFVLNLMTNFLLGSVVKSSNSNLVQELNPSSVIEPTLLEANQREHFELFDKQNLATQHLGLGSLVQFMFKYNGEWNLIAKQDDQYIVLNTESQSVDDLLIAANQVKESLS